MRTPADGVLEWYRPRLLGRLFLAWLAASGMLLVGVVALGMALDTTGRVPADWRGIALGCGVGGTVTGAVGGIFGILKLVSEDDRYLLVRGGGLEISSGSGTPAFYPWRQIQRIEVDAGQLLLHPAEGDPQPLGRSFQGIRLHALAERLTDLRRKALLGALRVPPPRRQRGW